MKNVNDTRRNFIKNTATGVAALSLGGITSAVASSPVSPTPPKKKRRVIDGMMHLEANGQYWDGLVEEVIEYYDVAGIDQGVILTTWTPSRESNDRTLAAYKKYPKRFIPFGHVRLDDSDWESELKRVSEPPWKGLKLHQNELKAGIGSKEGARKVIKKAAEFGIRIVKIHFVDYEAVEELTREISEVTWILPHMGCYGRMKDMQKYCELAKNRANVYLDTCAIGEYYEMGKGIEWAGADKITFATDGHLYSPLVEKAKMETLQLPTPYRTARLTDDQMDKIMGGNMAKLLGI